MAYIEAVLVGAIVLSVVTLVLVIAALIDV